MRTPAQCESMAQAFLKDAHSKQLPAQKRLEARGQAKRWRVSRSGASSGKPARPKPNNTVYGDALDPGPRAD